jgi:hypothetical protein
MVEMSLATNNDFKEQNIPHFPRYEIKSLGKIFLISDITGECLLRYCFQNWLFKKYMEAIYYYEFCKRFNLKR